ncbi:MAG: TIGR04283 family arsenosugar biosynthesis glycosyltransferase, partial [Elusimicrobia bacterium]|nr:TIGR04283 family arsenosugar biosynthesis glycosyltransferase [Elusimicrobiota bacterium]
APKGRGAQMNAGAKKAAGEILLFLHADTRLPENAFGAIAGALDSGTYGAGAFRLEIDSPDPWLRFVAWTANIRNFFTKTPYGDQAIFVRKELFDKLGGYRELPLMEDLDFMERVKAGGGRIVILAEAVRTSPRRWETEGLFYTTLMHNALRLLRLSGAGPEKIAAFRRAAGLGGKIKVLCSRGTAP